MCIPEDQGVEEILRDWPGEGRLLRPALRPGDGPGPGDGYDLDGVVVMGSRASVLEDHPWMRDLQGWLRPILDGSVRKPLLGICFGHQLVGRMAGGPIGFVHADHHKESGFDVTTLEGGRLLPGRHELRVVVSHFECVPEAPPGYRATARRPLVPVDGLEHEHLPIFTFQFHPEGREHFAQKCSLDVRGIDDRLRADSTRVLAAFRRLVLRECDAEEQVEAAS